MRVVVKKHFLFEKQDYVFITSQLKSKKIKIKEICKEMGISRSYFHDLFSGVVECDTTYIKYLVDKHEIVIPYGFCDL